MKYKMEITVLIVTWVTVIFLSGCQPAEPASMSNDQVIQIVENTLKAIDDGDYQSFTRDLSDEMKMAFTEEQLTSLTELLKNASGKYESCVDTDPQLTNNQGYAVYRLICNYEQESVIVTMTFKIGSDKIEGLFFDSTNLRKASQ